MPSLTWEGRTWLTITLLPPFNASRLDGLRGRSRQEYKRQRHLENVCFIYASTWTLWHHGAHRCIVFCVALASSSSRPKATPPGTVTPLTWWIHGWTSVRNSITIHSQSALILYHWLSSHQLSSQIAWLLQVRVRLSASQSSPGGVSEHAPDTYASEGPGW